MPEVVGSKMALGRYSGSETSTRQSSYDILKKSGRSNLDFLKVQPQKLVFQTKKTQVCVNSFRNKSDHLLCPLES